MPGYLRTILEKTGASGTTGVNTNALPTSNNADAKSETFYHGLHINDPIEVTFTKSTVDGIFQVEGTMDGTTYMQLAFRRMDIDSVVAGSLTLNASAQLLIALAQPTQVNRIIGLRVACWLSGAGAVGDTFTVKEWEGR